MEGTDRIELASAFNTTTNNMHIERTVNCERKEWTKGLAGADYHVVLLVLCF